MYDQNGNIIENFLQNEISDGKNSAHFQGESNQMHMMQDEQKIMSSSFSMKPLGNFSKHGQGQKHQQYMQN